MSTHRHDISALIVVATIGLLTMVGSAVAQSPTPEAPRAVIDTAAIARMQVSLVTCEPFDRIYSLYGHTGLRIVDPATHTDLLANWGIFDMRQRNFALRFTLGLTDYCMDIERWGDFCRRYQSYGCGIFEQVLDLSWEEKLRLCQLVDTNFLPENRYYRYNVLYDNCTTRVRDIIEQSVTSGHITYVPSTKKQSYRDLIHAWNGHHPWQRCGIDLLMGFPCDHIVDTRQAQFLPFTLSGDFASATITDSLGTRPLVKAARWVLPQRYAQAELSFVEENVLSPIGAAMAYVLIFIIIVMIETKRQRRLWQFDVVVLSVTGLIGVFLFVMLFSKHPTVSLNAQILIFNPLSLVFLLPIARALRRGRQSILLLIIAFLTGIGILLGFTIQHFAEGVMTLALFLLLTYLRNFRLKKNEKK